MESNILNADIAAESGKDLRLLSLKRETHDGIWCERALSRYPIEDCQRILQIFFQGLKPGVGELFVSIYAADASAEPGGLAADASGPAAASVPTGAAPAGLRAFSESGFLSLLRQSGFRIERQAATTEEGRRRLAWHCRRA